MADHNLLNFETLQTWHGRNVVITTEGKSASGWLRKLVMNHNRCTDRRWVSCVLGGYSVGSPSFNVSIVIDIMSDEGWDIYPAPSVLSGLLPGLLYRAKARLSRRNER